MLFTFDKKKKECLKSVAPKPFLHPWQKAKGLSFGLFLNLEQTSLKTPLFFFFNIKLAHLYVVFRSKAHKCQRFDTKL